MRRIVTQIDLGQLAPGVNFIDRGRFLVFLGEDGALRATRNRCLHQGGRFATPEGCRVRCPRHGWVLDAERMVYDNPTDGPRQPQLEVERDGTRIALIEDTPAAPWGDRAPREPLVAGELDVRYYAHACVRIRAAGYVLFTDPWLDGPAFARGWWLAHAPPEGALEELARADLIYISHNHSDHLNPTTLRALAAHNPEVLVLVPDFEVDIAHLVRRQGLQNVTAAPFGRWLTLAPGLRAMILPDGAAAGDSGILIEYRGHRILSTVDCGDLNGGVLPDEVELLMSSFSRGASGFPVCWGELMSAESIQSWVKQDARNVLLRVCDTVKRVEPRAFLPYASFFVEAHPADAEIRRVNLKTSAQEVCHVLARVSPETWTIAPRPGDCIDLAQLAVSRGPPAREPDWRFAEHLAPLEACRTFAPLDRGEGVLHYFRWSGYRGDLILHLIETNDAFQPAGRSWLIDLAGPRLLGERPSTPHRYLRLRVRGDVFRHTLRHGLPWDEISIGFNARMYREPNVYNRDFWAHFQNCLPPEPPWGPGGEARLALASQAAPARAEP